MLSEQQKSTKSLSKTSSVSWKQSRSWIIHDEIYILEMWELGDVLNDRWTFVKLYLQTTISEPQTGIELATFLWSVRRPNHWAAKTQDGELRCKFDICATYIKRHQEVVSSIAVWSSEVVFWGYSLRNVYPSFKMSPSSHISQISISLLHY